MTESANWLNRRAAHAVLAQRMPFLQSDYQIDVWIDLPIEEARQTFIPFRISTEQDGNGTRLRCGRDRLDLFAAMLLTTRRDIVIHSPAELRETFSELVFRALHAAAHQSETPLSS